MSYLVVENFKRGLDTRRNILTSEPGCLVEMDNAHVTRGGEVEKRKAFKLVGNVGIETYGLEGCGDTVFVFGSAATAQVPPGVTYQRLVHPDGPSFSMTKVVSFTSYAGKPFVIAEFNDGSRYCYYNGEVVPDSVNGIYRLSHGNVEGFLNHIKTLLPDGYTATVTGSGITIIGPQGKDFTVTTRTSGKFTAGTPTKSQTAVKPIPEVLSRGLFTISSGSYSPAYCYLNARQTRYENLPNLTGIFVDGVDILNLASIGGIDWNAAPGGSAPDETAYFFYTLVYYINLNTAQSGYKARFAPNWGDWSGRKPCEFWIESATGDPTAHNGDVVLFEFAARPVYPGVVRADRNDGEASFAWGAETKSQFFRPGEDPQHDNGRWVIPPVRPVLVGGAFNGVSSVKIDGVEVMGTPIIWSESNSATATAIADAINNYQSSFEMTASTVDGGKIVLTALTGTGNTVNGKVVSVQTTGNCTVSALVNFTGGVNPVGGVSQRTSLSLSTSGTHSETVGSTLGLTIIEADNTTYPKYCGATAMAGLKLNYCFTYKSKVNLLADSYLISSALDDPKDWKSSGIGVFFIDMSNNTNGTEDLVAAAPYQGKLAVFSRSSCQIWAIDVDPQNNALSQVVLNTGTVAPGSVISYGELDVFYLSDSGIRSLRARDSSSQAQVADVGVNIDTIVSQKLSEIPESTIFNTACSVIEPRDNRLIMNVYDKMFVHSSYPTAGIQAWSTYTPEILPVKLMTIKGNMYARYGNSIYLYGGTSGNEYDGSTASMTLPYLDGGKPAHQKHLEGVDLTSDGSWDFYVGTDPYRPEVRDHIGIIDNSTFQLGRVIAVGIGTHIGVKLTSRGNTYGRIGNLILHFQINEAD